MYIDVVSFVLGAAAVGAFQLLLTWLYEKFIFKKVERGSEL